VSDDTPRREADQAAVPFFRLTADEFEVGRTLGVFAYAVYTYLAYRQGGNGHCFPSQDDVAAQFRISTRKVRDVIAVLRSAKLLTVERDDAHQRNTYHVARAQAPRAGGQAEHRHHVPVAEAPHAGEHRHHVPPNKIHKNKIQRTRTKSAGAPEQSAGAIDVPPALDTPEFRAAWGEWIAYRRQRGKKPYADATVARKLAKLAAWGPGKAVAAIGYSIEKGWEDIYQPEQGGTSNGKPATNRIADAIRRERYDPNVVGGDF